MARGMATSSWGGQDAVVLMNVSEYRSQPPGGYTMHLRTPAMTVALRGEVRKMVGRGGASWQIQEYKRWRHQCNNQPANKRLVKGKA